MKTIINMVLFVLMPMMATAQCPQVNTAFQSGEKLEYTMYYNWSFVWVKAGTATLTTNSTTYQGQPVYKSKLITSTTKKLDKFFCLRDTIEAIVTPEIVPLWYRKGANEGGQYRLNEAWYSYPNGKSHVKLYYRNHDGSEVTNNFEQAECIYDMVSMMLRARSFRGEDFKVGQRLLFPMADHRKVKQETLVYRGMKTIETKDGKTKYRCMLFSFVEKKGKKEKNVIDFYISDDENHLPVRLDMNLNFGTAKAYLTGAENLRNPQTSIVN